MEAKTAKEALLNTIREMDDYKWLFSARPGKDNTRNRKFSFPKVVSCILAFRGGTLTHEILDFFGCDPSVGTSSAFIQQRAKILPEAFEFLFRDFTQQIDEGKLYKGLRLLAVDGSDLKIATNSQDPDSYYPGANGQKPYNLLHLNALYDLEQHIYLDALTQKSRKTNEIDALAKMVDRSPLENALLMADRGYESYNGLAHVQEKGWRFLFRIKDEKSGIAAQLDLPDEKEFDISFELNLTKKQSKQVKQLLNDKNHYKYLASSVRFDYLPQSSKRRDPAVFYTLRFRIVRFPISDTQCETIITNLDADLFPLEEIKRLYARRWGIENSFRDLKHTLGLLHFHAKKVEFILQEVFAKLTMYNFCECITQSVVIQQAQKKYSYQVNFSVAVHICLRFFLGKVPPPFVEALLAKYIQPIRPGRQNIRKLFQKPSVSFFYRVA